MYKTLFCTLILCSIRLATSLHAQSPENLQQRLVRTTDSMEASVATNMLTDTMGIAKTAPLAPHARLIDSIIDYGYHYLGKPYKYGATGPYNFDCSGLMVYIFQHFGYNLPRTAKEQYQSTEKVNKRKGKRGDFIFFEGRKHNGHIGHVGIITEVKSNGTYDFLHASRQGVCITNTAEAYYTQRFLKISRLLPPFDACTNNTMAMQSVAHEPIETETVATAEQQHTTHALQNKYHTVRQGESLYQIARKYSIDVTVLKQWNRLRGNIIRPNQRLIVGKTRITTSQKLPETNMTLPEDTTAAEQQHTTHALQNKYHTVRQGESLYQIARKYGINVTVLKQWNRLRGNIIRPNQRLIVGKTRITTSQKLPETNMTLPEDKTAAHEVTTTHVVTVDDTLWNLAHRYRTTVSHLQELNGLADKNIKIGQQLIVPKR